MRRDVPDERNTTPPPYQLIVEHAECEPGEHKEHFCDVFEGWFDAREVKTVITATRPNDNGVKTSIRKVPAS